MSESRKVRNLEEIVNLDGTSDLRVQFDDTGEEVVFKDISLLGHSCDYDENNDGAVKMEIIARRMPACEHEWSLDDVSFVTQTDENPGTCMKMRCKKCGVVRHSNLLCGHV